MQKTLSTLDNKESAQVAEAIISDIADQIQTVESYILVDDEENSNFISILKQVLSGYNENARELFAYLLGVAPTDLDLQIQEIIEQTLNCD